MILAYYSKLRVAQNEGTLQIPPGTKNIQKSVLLFDLMDFDGVWRDSGNDGCVPHVKAPLLDLCGWAPVIPEALQGVLQKHRTRTI